MPVPLKNKLYIKTQHHKLLCDVITSQMFYPVFLTGLSGNGKTMSIEQACASTDRELIRVNITCETEEDDLLGGFRLIDGNTVWQDGPVILAMKHGAILLLDEVDLGTNKILCLQSVLEGTGVFLKKIGQYIKCEPGFNVFATANTKGQGDETGKFIGTNILNEAFLERFPMWLSQEYPTISQERKILNKIIEMFNIDINAENHGNYIEALLKWAEQIRDAYKEGVYEELITTRRLVQILKTFKIVNNVNKSVELCLNKFDLDTKSAFILIFNQFYISTGSDQTDDKSTTEIPENPEIFGSNPLTL